MRASTPKQTVYRKQEPERRSAWNGGASSFIQRIGFIIYVEARAALSLGSLYGGLCLGPVNTAAVHALAYPLGGRFRIAHGVSNALLLPHVMRFNFSAAPERFAEIAVALGRPRQSSAHSQAENGVQWLTQLSRDCGVPQTLSELNIPSAAIPSLARSAMQVTRLLQNNLRPLAETDAIGIYEAAY